MSQPVTFNDRTIIEPGAYAQIKGAVERAVVAGEFSTLVFIDTNNLNSGGYGWGSGVNGTIQNGQDAIYEFDNLVDFQTAVGGGVIYDLAKFWFKPSRDIRQPGIRKLFYVRALTTAPATETLTFVGSGSDGGVFTIRSKAEGLVGNGATNGLSSTLSTGFGIRMVAGTFDANKFKVQFYRGTYRGTDTTASDTPLIDDRAENTTEPELLTESIEFDNVAQLKAWMDGNTIFNDYFELSSYTLNGTGEVTTADLTALAGWNLFAGGTQSYSADDLVDALDALREVDYTFITSDRYGTLDAAALSIFNHTVADHDYNSFFIFGGGFNSGDFNDPADNSTDRTHSIQQAEQLDSAFAYVVHSGVKRPNFNGTAIRNYSSLYHAGLFAGRLAGLEPQVPITWLDLDITGVVHQLSKSEREFAIQNGVIHQRNVQERGGFVVNQESNSKQDNMQDIYQDGTSPHGSIMRIASLLNKELVQNLRRNFIAGQNANTSSPADIKSYVETYLRGKIATPNDDNLILNFQNVTVQLSGSDYNITYAITPNGPISRIFVTGFLLPINLSA
jgi:hypothetical protein